MSGHHGVEPAGSHSEILHLTLLSDHFGALIDKYCDILIVVSGHRFYGHKPILAARSEYFRALFYGGMMESKQAEIQLKGISIPAFTALLKYIYTGQLSLAIQKEKVILEILGQLSLANQNEKVLLEILGLAHQYGFTDLEHSISDYLCQIIQISNVFMIYGAAQLHQQKFLASFCCSFIDRNVQELIHHETFWDLSSINLKQIIARDTFYAPEGEIFHAVANWIQANKVDASDNISENNLYSNCSNTVDGTNQARAVQEVLSAVRFPLLSLSDIVSVVRPSNLLSDVAILEAIEAIDPARNKELKLRGYLVPEENIAHPSCGAQVLLGEMGSALWVVDGVNLDKEENYTRHVISWACDRGILIKLGTQAFLNHIKMLLFDNDGRSYSYYIEVSVNEKDWDRVIDHTRHLCRSWQFLYFETRAVRFIRIVGTKSTVSNSFHVVSFVAMYTETPITLDCGLVVPKLNVASAECSASLIEGSRRNHDLFFGDVNNYAPNSGFAEHVIGDGAIVVQLGQPYMLDSMRLLLWDLDDRTYSYKVEVSVNSSDWELVVDKTREDCRSWQTLTFERRPVVFIRIEGTKNTAIGNMNLHCVHLECPAETSDAENQSTETCETEANV